MAGEPAILTLDVGSSSIRSRLYSVRLEPTDPGPGASIPVYWRRPRPGSMECEPEQLRASVVAALDAAVGAARESGLRIGAVAVTTFWHGLLGVDGAGDPLTPLFGWGDSRSGSAGSRLRERLDERSYHQRTGCFLRPVYPLVKLAWLRESDRATFEAVRAWISIGEYIEESFLGVRRSSHSIASGTGLLDVRSLRWDGESLDAVGLDPSRLPGLADGHEPGSLLSRWARRWPELAGIPWFPPVGDGACASLGSGALGPTTPALTVGTSAAVRVLWEAPREELPAELWTYRLDRRRWVSGMALSNGGNALTFLLRLFPSLSAADVDRALTAPPAGDRLTVIPTLVAERSEEGAREGAATVIGLRPDTTPEAVARAWLEAVAYRVAEAFERLESHFGRASGIRGSGGALHGLPAWVQTFADVLDRPVGLATDREATSRGAAGLALESLGWTAGPDPPLPAIGPEVRPDPERHAAHRVAMRRQRRLASAMRDWSNDSSALAASDDL